MLPDNSFNALWWSQVFRMTERPVWIVENDAESAESLYRDLRNFTDSDRVFFLPAACSQLENPSPSCLYDLNARITVRDRFMRTPRAVAVTFPEAFLQPVPSDEWFDNRFRLAAGDKLDIEFLNEFLFESDYEQTDMVTLPGEFSRWGSVMDVFPYGSAEPYRLEFDYEKIVRLRPFDIETQLTRGEATEIDLLPPPRKNDFMRPLWEIFPPDTILYVRAPGSLMRQAESQKSGESTFSAHFDERKLHSDTVFLSSQIESDVLIHPEVENLVPFGKDFQKFRSFLESHFQKNYRIILTSPQEERLQRLLEHLNEYDLPARPHIWKADLRKGFRDVQTSMLVIPEHEIFGRPPVKHTASIKRKKQRQLLRHVSDWQPGDYVVHADYGTGIFEGLVKLNKNGRQVETVKLRYKDGDVLYVGIHSLYKLSRYRSQDGKPPKIYRLGSGAWERLKQRTKKKIKKLAFDLLKLYAERKNREGFAFGPDSSIQWELESSFMYEETPDQRKAIEDVKRDMESPRPMDRLVCGDVGFGKTEVAVRAAFKAADNGKQVAVLVPTTLLALQHYKTFVERLKNYPVEVEYLNRFRSPARRRQILRDLAEGKIDIIIGTHALVSEAVKFKDLGLLIIDEEQKFGVNVKEKIKNLKSNIDVLTLTATPIPRTLQFSLMGERDLSVINTPPPNRYPIETRVIRFDPTELQKALQREIARGGQVFVVHNRIASLENTRALLESLVPDARIAVVHGKTEGKQLEKIMTDFRAGEYDILLSTAIIESGLDIPNANTMIVLDAHMFGLADLHQLRGRVGRSNRKAYCYFVIPSYETLTPEARKRIRTLETYTALGDGFEIALKDLEIRGAGNILGAEQSGFINEMGVDMYRKILEEAVEELKSDAFADVFDRPEFKALQEVQFQSDRDGFFPDEYMPSGRTRMHYYRMLNLIKTPEEQERLRNEIRDRFGPLPPEAENLFRAVDLKNIAARLGFEKISWKHDRLTLYFTDRPDFARSHIRSRVLQWAAVHDDGLQFKEKDGKYLLIRRGIRKWDELKNFLQTLHDAVYSSAG